MSKYSEVHKFLAMDCETSGMNTTGIPSEGYQMVSIAMIVSDTKTYKELDTLYIEIKWNGKSGWNTKAESIHGMTKEYLEEYGVDEEEAVVQIVEFLMKHFDLNKAIVLAGHNAASFDVHFIKDLLKRFDVTGVRFAHRIIDTFSLGLVALGANDSDELFDKLGFQKRKAHNALVDIQYTLRAIRLIKKIFDIGMECENV